jgi:hypothetical protein
MSDETPIVVAVHTAYKFLVIDLHFVNLGKRAIRLEMNRKRALEVEWQFLGVVDYRVWVREEEYVEFKGRCEALWEGVFKGVKRAEPPAWLKLKTKTAE